MRAGTVEGKEFTFKCMIDNDTVTRVTGCTLPNVIRLGINENVISGCSKIRELRVVERDIEIYIDIGDDIIFIPFTTL